MPKTGETSSVLLSVTGILFLIGGLVFLYRKKSWRKEQ
ncbi:LPXTG cell wall anchor domain-containing protein [Enterococcus casseliflavus]|nr:LPXTG cell wall anchor domain-containing protein [Enterococcus casseliflavus]